MYKPQQQLIGCVAAHGPSFYDYRWHDSEISVGKDCTAVQKAILECAFAGCDSIWVTCPAQLAVILKHTIGTTVLDPIYFRKIPAKELELQRRPMYEFKRTIPIFYIPMKYEHLNKRDSWAMAAINSGLIASKTLKKSYDREKNNLDRFFLAFPFGMLPYRLLDYGRKKRTKYDKVFLSYKGKTIKDGLWLSCIVTYKDLRDLLRWIKDKEKIWYEESGGRHCARYSSKNFTLKDVFSNLSETNDLYEEINWYYDASNWDGLMDFFKEHGGYWLTPTRLFTRKIWIKI